MKLVLKTKAKHFYVVRLPNYFDMEQQDQLIEDVSKLIPSEIITEHTFYNDAMPTMEERSQLDCYGKVIDSPVELVLQ
jgi:hypothetical protein